MSSLILKFNLQVDSVQLNQIASSVKIDDITLQWVIAGGIKTLSADKQSKVDLSKDINIGQVFSITSKISQPLGSSNFTPINTTLCLLGENLGKQCEFDLNLATYGDCFLKQDGVIDVALELKATSLSPCSTAVLKGKITVNCLEKSLLDEPVDENKRLALVDELAKNQELNRLLEENKILEELRTMKELQEENDRLEKIDDLT